MRDQLAPGPWFVDPEWGPSAEFPLWAAIRMGSDSSLLVSGHVGTTNARVLAAAWDMLEVLKLLTNGYKYPTEVCQIARAAVAKATGEV